MMIRSKKNDGGRLRTVQGGGGGQGEERERKHQFFKKPVKGNGRKRKNRQQEDISRMGYMERGSAEEENNNSRLGCKLAVEVLGVGAKN